jgi:hypothetical protein
MSRGRTKVNNSEGKKGTRRENEQFQSLTLHRAPPQHSAHFPPIQSHQSLSENLRQNPLEKLQQ